MSSPTIEQQKVIDHPIQPMSVNACAGSGKTKTAVHRVANISHRIKEQKGSVVLLSFSNVAVDTFRYEFSQLNKNKKSTTYDSNVVIETFDSFITSNIIKPHAYRAMQADRSAFLVNGTEPFLKSFNVWDGTRPRDINELEFSIKANKAIFKVSNNNTRMEIPTKDALNSITKLGKTGAYTHDLGRYWALKTLSQERFLLKILARKFPHIVVDEAQDIGTAHEYILRALKAAGIQISLIGDVNQGIYEFAGATGKFLNDYANKEKIEELHLTKNFRSVPKIQAVANKISLRNDDFDREEPDHFNGAYYLEYEDSDLIQLITKYKTLIAKANLTNSNATIICRGNKLVSKLKGTDEALGGGIMKKVISATIKRDLEDDYHSAFKLFSEAIASMLENRHRDFLSLLFKTNETNEIKALRRELWRFLKDTDIGLPSLSLKLRSEWQPLLINRVKILLDKLSSDHDLKNSGNIGKKLNKGGLPDTAILVVSKLTKSNNQKIRTETVHHVKGESIDAVMYVAKKSQIQSLINGTNTEEGRIGYVAVTRARNLFILALPKNTTSETRASLLSLGFQNGEEYLL